MRIFTPAVFLLCLAAAAAEPDRSPVDLVLSPDGAWLVTANQSSGTVSLVGTADGLVLDEQPAGEHPAAIALHPAGNRILSTAQYSGELFTFTVREGRLEQSGAVAVGFHPHGVAVSPDGKLAYVATTAADQVAVVDLEAGEVVERIDVGRWPRSVALSPDGLRLAVATSGDRGVAVVDCRQRKLLYIEQFIGLNIGHLWPSRDGVHVYFPWMVYRRNPISAGNIRLGWVLASRIARVRLDGPARREALSLDQQGRAVADPHGIALTSDEGTLVCSASGTHELLVFRMSDLPLLDHGGTDHIPPELLEDSERFYRIDLGGRPMGLRIAADDRTVNVADYLGNSVKVVDLDSRQVVREIALGGAEEQTPARRGEEIFYDGRRSLDQWYSCHTCHYDGGTNSVEMDTTNDGTRFTFKTVLPLYGLAETGPWTWHGWQKDLDAAMKKSLTETMLGPRPADDDVQSLLAYLKTLKTPPNPFREADGSLGEAALRGRAVFESAAAGCATCHSGPRFTDGEIHDVETGKPGDRYDGFNTPSLIGVYSRVKLLHDGRAASLDQLLTGPHNPARVAGERELTDDERRDLIEYLKSL